MPIYAFVCNTCGHTFERLQKLADADPEVCPACAAQTVQRQLTAPQFRLSGSGWYETDFKKDGETKRNLVDKCDGASATPSDSRNEAKGSGPAAAPAAKSESKPSPSSSDGA